jgi:lysophosphatidate acyltransferase
MMLPFKKGAFHFAIQAGVPIVPVVVANYSHLFSVKKRRFEAGRVKIQGIFFVDCANPFSA